MSVEYIQDIIKLLNREQYFLMYRGGAGGEFFSTLISNHSNRFRKTQSVYNPETNKTNVYLPKFYECLIAIKTKTTSYDILLEKIIEIHKTFNFNLEETLVEANRFLDEGLPPLIRTHYTFTEYFNKKNTWLIVQDEERWFEYTGRLLYTKTGMFPMPASRAESHFNYSLGEFPHKKDRFDRALEYIRKNNIQTIYGLQIEPILSDELNISFEEIFNTPPNILVQKYEKYFDLPYKEFYDRTMSIMGHRTNIIPFSKIFCPGFIEETFNIDLDLSPQINEWHTKNLELLKREGFDIDKYLDE